MPGTNRPLPPPVQAKPKPKPKPRATKPKPPAPPGPPEEDRLWALGAHLGALVLGFGAPLLVRLTRGERSGYVRQHATESLNFQLTVSAVGLVCLGASYASLFAFFALLGVGAAWFVLTIIAGTKAYQGQPFRYPVNVRLIRP